MPTAKLPTIDLCYERAGEGPPLLFISGTGGDLRVKPRRWAEAQAYIARTAAAIDAARAKIEAATAVAKGE
jgi:hypothetical protein